MLVLFLTVGLGMVGFLDDFIKIKKQRSLGLRSKAKIAGQSIVAVIFGVLALMFFPDDRGIYPASKSISFLRDIAALPELPLIVALIWILFLIAAASNGVNLTDGLDGLATGACVMIFGAYTLVNIWQYNQSCAYTSSAGPKCYEVRDPYDLAVVAVALAGACFGFLWWNAEPAKIFMGDTGSLSLGGALAGLAIFTRTELLLIILGGLLVIEVMSVILQTGFFKLTRRITGTPQRLFKMTPVPPPLRAARLGPGDDRDAVLDHRRPLRRRRSRHLLRRVGVRHVTGLTAAHRSRLPPESGRKRQRHAGQVVVRAHFPGTVAGLAGGGRREVN